MIGGHGHVRPRADGMKARCGGPALCVECAKELIVAMGEAMPKRDENIGKMIAGYNILRGALAWYDSHEIERKLGHLPQWVTMARDLLKDQP